MTTLRGIRTSPGAVIGIGLAVGVPLVFVALFFLLPLTGMLGLGLFPEGEFAPGAFLEVFTRPRTLRIIGLTLLQAGVATLVAVLLGVPLAFVLYRLRFRGAGLLRTLVLVPFVLPTVVVGVAFRTLLRPDGWLGFLGLDESFTAIILALVFFNLSVVVRTVGVHWEGLDARQAQAAATLGASPSRSFLTVTLPALAPAIRSAASVVFLFCATAFGVVLVLGGLRFGTIETEIYLLTMQYLDLPAAAALSVAQLLLVGVLLWSINRGRKRVQTGDRAQVVTSPARMPRAADWPLLLLAALTVTALALPLLALLWRSLQGPDGFGLGNYLALGAGGGTTNVWQALGNSVLIALQAAALAVLLGALASFALSRRPRSPRLRRLQSVFDATLMLPLGVSAVTIGLGILITLNRPPLDLRSSMILIPIAQALVALPLVVRVLLPVLGGIDQRLKQSAAVLGASPFRVLRDVELPILAKPLAAASAFAFAVSLGEFGATSFLARPDAPTLPVLIYRLISRPGAEQLGMALAASVLLALLTMAMIAVVERLRSGAMSQW